MCCVGLSNGAVSPVLSDTIGFTQKCQRVFRIPIASWTPGGPDGRGEGAEDQFGGH
jgi:hypothetical protein